MDVRAKNVTATLKPSYPLSAVRFMAQPFAVADGERDRRKSQSVPLKIPDCRLENRGSYVDGQQHSSIIQEKKEKRKEKKVRAQLSSGATVKMMSGRTGLLLSSFLSFISSFVTPLAFLL
jgi:transcription antitermination factor NusG